MFGYRVPHPDEAMLISGGRHAAGQPFQVVVGRGKFVFPLFRKVEFLTLRMQESQVQEQCTTTKGINLLVQAVIAFKVGNDEESIVNAGQRFLSDQNQMSSLTGRIFAGHLRSIVGSMTVEQIIQERQTLAQQVLEASKEEMARIGLVVDSLQIQSIDDQRSGYIDAMGQAQRAEIARQAAVAQAQAAQATKIAQAQSEQAAVEAEQKSKQNQSSFAAETAQIQAANDAKVQKAQAEAAATIGAAKATADASVGVAQAKAQAQVQEETARAAQAGPLANAQASQQVAEEQTKLAEQNAKLRQQQLAAEVVKPAEADAEKTRVLAKADAEKQTVLAQAAASANRVTLDQQLITLLPQITEKAAAGLAGSNLTIFNGAQGMEDMLTQLVGQGMTIMDVLKRSLNGNGAKEAGREVER